MTEATPKFGICSGYIDGHGEIRKGKSLGIYGDGPVDRERIESEILPIVREKNIDSPFIVYSYYARPFPSELDTSDIIIGKSGLWFNVKKVRLDPRPNDWFVDEKKKIYKIRNSKIVTESE